MLLIIMQFLLSDITIGVDIDLVVDIGLGVEDIDLVEVSRIVEEASFQVAVVRDSLASVATFGVRHNLKGSSMVNHILGAAFEVAFGVASEVTFEVASGVDHILKATSFRVAFKAAFEAAFEVAFEVASWVDHILT